MRSAIEKTESRANENKHYRRKYCVKQLLCEVVARWMYRYYPFVVPFGSVFSFGVVVK